jgi:hypothetical protein
LCRFVGFENATDRYSIAILFGSRSGAGESHFAKFFGSQGYDKAMPGIAEHIRKFRDPRKRGRRSRR